MRNAAMRAAAMRAAVMRAAVIRAAVIRAAAMRAAVMRAAVMHAAVIRAASMRTAAMRTAVMCSIATMRAAATVRTSRISGSALSESLQGVDIVAATAGPGLLPCLQVSGKRVCMRAREADGAQIGFRFAEALARERKLPFVGVNHLEVRCAASC